MTRPTSTTTPYTLLIYRPFWLALGGLLITLTIALVILINTSWKNLDRTEPLKAHMAMIQEIQQYNSELDAIRLSDNTRLNSKQIKQIDDIYIPLMNMLNTSTIISDEARPPLLKVAYALQAIKADSTFDLSDIKENIQSALHTEVAIQNNLLHLLAKGSRLELKTTTFIAIALPLLGLSMLFFLRRRILRPLHNLSLLIDRLGRQTLPSVPLDDIDPLLKPVFVNFRNLVARLSKLEQEQRNFQLSLQDKVKYATQSLLEYQHALAQSERLAAVGELTAGLAHELRNPLAGIHMALSNLRSELTDQDKLSRLTLVLDELDRITKLLSQVLDQSQHTPEAATQFEFGELLDTLVQLVSFQIPENITLEQTIEDNIQCNLPAGRLRQALLNLIVNSAQSLGKKDGVINISAKINDSKLVITVWDNGPGFPETILRNGVQAFSTGREHGTGLGLAIVWRFCYELGGNLKLYNPTSGGACAEIILPRISPNE